MYSKIGLIFFLFIFTLSSLNSCVAQSNKNKIVDQWKVSLHSKSMSTPEFRERMNKTGCAHCHTKQGFHEVTLAKKPSTAPYKDAKGIICTTCHKPKDEANKSGTLRVDGVKNACICHDELVENTSESLLWCSQYEVQRGKSKAIFTNEKYENGAHTQLEKGCVSCHMAQTASGLHENKIGGHTFRVITKGDSPKILNPKACLTCHDAMILDLVEKSQAKFKSLLKEFALLLPQKLIDKNDSTKTEPKYPADPSLTKIESMASYNYWLVVKDGTFGIHNPPYMKKLLKDSITKLKSGQ